MRAKTTVHACSSVDVPYVISCTAWLYRSTCKCSWQYIAAVRLCMLAPAQLNANPHTVCAPTDCFAQHLSTAGPTAGCSIMPSACGRPIAGTQTTPMQSPLPPHQTCQCPEDTLTKRMRQQVCGTPSEANKVCCTTEFIRQTSQCCVRTISPHSRPRRHHFYTCRLHQLQSG